MEAVTGSIGLPGGLGGATGGSLPLGTPDLAPPAGNVSGLGLPAPNSPL